MGHWETQMVEVACAPVRCRCRLHRGCGGCGSCGGCCDPCAAPATRTVCQRVWVPNCVTEEVPVTVCRTVMVNEPCTYTVQLCRQETRQVTVKVMHCRLEQRTRSYQVCTMKPEVRTRVVPCTRYEMQQQTREVTRTVCVPVQVEKDVQVRVCHMVERKVQVPVTPSCAPSCVRRVRGCRSVGCGGCGC